MLPEFKARFDGAQRLLDRVPGYIFKLEVRFEYFLVVMVGKLGVVALDKVPRYRLIQQPRTQARFAAGHCLDDTAKIRPDLSEFQEGAAGPSPI